MKKIEVIASPEYLTNIRVIADRHGAEDWWVIEEEKNQRCIVGILVEGNQRQSLMDELHNLLEKDKKSRLMVFPVEAALSHQDEVAVKGKQTDSNVVTTRQEIYSSIEKGAKLNSNFIVLTILSTIVAAIGLVENNIAVIIGAMVIAPLLGPNLALALGTSLGDATLVWKSIKTNIVGILLALVSSILIGFMVSDVPNTPEILSRTRIGMDGVALALASGAAGVLSITTGVSTVLVGVMVAVALLPPTATIGLMIGKAEYALAYGAALMLMVNIVCVNLSAKVVFAVKGIKPRTWNEQKKASQSRRMFMGVWAITLLILMGLIVLSQQA